MSHRRRRLIIIIDPRLRMLPVRDDKVFARRLFKLPIKCLRIFGWSAEELLRQETKRREQEWRKAERKAAKAVSPAKPAKAAKAAKAAKPSAA